MTYRGILAAFLLWPLAAFGQTYPSSTFSKITVNIPITASSTTGAINYGALPYSDTGNFGVMVGNTNSFLQWTLLNLSTGTTASADYIVGNSTTTASTHYGDFGMNSSGFAGSGALNAPGNVFLTSTTNDLVIGTTTANGIHFVVNNGVTDAMAISSAGAVTVAGVAVLVNGGALGTPSSGRLTNVTGLPISTGLTGTGTGVLTALAVNVGTAGSFVVNGGAFGTPSSGTLTNATGLPISTGVSGLGTGVATALGVSTGSAGAFVVNGGALGTPSSGTLTNATGYTTTNLTTVTSGTAPGAGKLGEVISSTLVSGSAITPSNNTVANVTSVSLTAGHWRCGGLVAQIVGTGSTSIALYGWISTTSAAFPTPPTTAGEFGLSLASQGGGAYSASPTGLVYFDFSGTTTVYLEGVYTNSLTVAPNNLFGTISCERHA